MIITDYEKFAQEYQRRWDQAQAGRTTPVISASSGLQARYRGSHYNGGQKSYGGLSSSGSSQILDHYVMRQNARAAYHDSTQARSVIERFADTVIDVGLKLEPTPKFKIIGISPEQAEEWAEDHAERFDCWAMDRRCFRDESMNFYQGQRLTEIFAQRDNDYFVRLYYSNRRDLLNPLQLSFIDPNQINGVGYTTTLGFQAQNDGIERDELGREVAYHVRVLEGGKYVSKRIPAIGARSGRRMMIHGFEPEYAGQGRGYSRIAHAMQEFEKITDFSLSTIQKAINQSSITMYTKPSSEHPASNPLEEITNQYAAGPAAAMYGSDPATGDVLPLSEYLQYVELPEATITRPGSVGLFNLQSGEDLKAFQDTAPSESFDRFVDSFTSYLSASMSMPIEVLLMKFSENYSASRGALILFWRVAEIRRAERAADFLNPIWEAWLSGEIAAGRSTAPGWGDPRIRAGWLANNWVGAPMPNIDPMKTARADKEYVSMGAQTLDRVSRNLNGSSGKANRMKLTREFGELPPDPWTNRGGNNG